MSDYLNITDNMKAEVMGEHFITINRECLECYDLGDKDDCPMCQGEGIYPVKVEVDWTTCKEIYKHMVEVKERENST